MNDNDTADWSGNCPLPNSKKHFPPPPSNIASSVGIESTGWRPSRRVAKDGTNGSEFSPSPLMNPSAMAVSTWQTEAQSASTQVKTSQNQLTESGRSMFVRGKACIIPTCELSRPCVGSVAEILRDDVLLYPISDKKIVRLSLGQETKQDQDNIPGNIGESLVGYRSGVDGKSLLSGLSTEIAASLEPSSTNGKK